MAVKKLTDDLAIIQKQSDDPVRDESYTTSQFKAEFDKAALIIQNYLNTVIVPALDAVNSGAIVMSETKPEVYPVLWLDISGAGVKQVYVDSYGISHTIYPITKLAYIDGFPAYQTATENSIQEGNQRLETVKSYLQARSITIPADNWGTSAPFTLEVTIPGIPSDWNPGIPFLAPSGDMEKDLSAQESLSCLSKIEVTSSGKLLFTCYEYKPEYDMTIYIPGVLR